jgi:hypothetical protein
MPVMNGAEAAKALHDEMPDVPVFLFTGHATASQQSLPGDPTIGVCSKDKMRPLIDAVSACLRKNPSHHQMSCSIEDGTGNKGCDMQTWRELYSAAVLETDANRLVQRIDEATSAMCRRDLELGHTTDGDAERQEMAHASEALIVLKSDQQVWRENKSTSCSQ